MESVLTIRLHRTRYVQNPCRLAAAVALDTGKIIKKLPGVFDRGEDFLQNGIQNFDYLYLQSSDITLQSPTCEKAVFFIYSVL